MLLVFEFTKYSNTANRRYFVTGKSLPTTRKSLLFYYFKESLSKGSHAGWF